MAKAKPKKRKVDPLLERARAAAFVRYNPERAALSGLEDQAESDLLTGARIQQGVAQGMRAAVREAAPRLQQSYASGTGQVNAADDRFRSDTAGLGVGVDPYRGAAARETAATQGRLVEGGIAAQAEAGSREVQAEAGRAAGIRQLTSEYQKNRGKISDRRLALNQEEGAFIASTFGDLNAAELKAQQQARDDAEQRRHNRVQEGISQGNLDVAEQNADTSAAKVPKDPNKMTPTQNRATQAAINTGWTVLNRLRKGGLKGSDLRQAAEALASGGTKGIPKLPDPLYGQAAYDLVVTGRLSSRTYHALKAQGYAVPHGWLPRKPKAKVPLSQVGGTVNVG